MEGEMTGPFDDLTPAQRRQIRDAQASRKEVQWARVSPTCEVCGKVKQGLSCCELDDEIEPAGEARG
jgi:hypothetical protein